MTTIIISLLASALFCSIALNVFLTYRIKKKQPKSNSIEIREFLTDLLSGPAMLAIARIDPGDVMLRSPKQR